MSEGPVPRRGAHHLRAALILVVTSWGLSSLLQVALFARPTPYGAAYMQDWPRYFFHALFYDVLGHWLLAAPFLGVWSLRWSRPSEGRWPWLNGGLVAVLAAGLGFNHADHEIMRFMGSHLSLSFLATYGALKGTGGTIDAAVLSDAGGVGVPPLLLGVPILFALGATWWLRRATPRPMGRRSGLAAVLLPLAITTTAYYLPGGKFRIWRVRPVQITWGVELIDGILGPQAPADLDATARAYQARWLAEDATGAWRFPSTTYPYVREPLPQPPLDTGGARWNVIYFQLETFRAWDVGLTRPDRADSPTPFLDSLARSPEGAWWSRHYSVGPPTVGGFFMGHCGQLPHSRRNITTSFAYIDFYCLPQALRDHGYRAEYFTGSDPDWDNQRLFLQRWYDDFVFYEQAGEDDAYVFPRAAERIRALGRSGRPFMATVVSISNHYPFRTRDPAADVTAGTTPRDKIRNTMHYTDVLLQRLVESLRDEPWFAHTLLVFTGDHAYNLGEHDGQPGQRNLFRESTWVPLIIYGDHPALPRGRQPEVASMADIAPTVADLLGVRARVPWTGHSLVRGPRPQARFAFEKGLLLFAETPTLSITREARSPTLQVFDPALDPLQRHPLGATVQAEAAQVAAQTSAARTMNDYLIETNRIWDRP